MTLNHVIVSDVEIQYLKDGDSFVQKKLSSNLETRVNLMIEK